jgi:hypothetical protein
MLALQKKSYAHSVNAYYQNSDNNIVSLEQRIADTIGSLPDSNLATVQQMIAAALAEFKRIYGSQITKWEDLHLAQSVYVTLTDIYIDTTMQRLLDLHWVSKLLSKFKTTKVIPIQVYVGDDGKLCAWDGQHTAVLLYIICVHALKLDPSKVKVPVNIYPSSKKSEMRECFLDLNSAEGKRSLDNIDHWIQEVFGVRIDGSNNPGWKMTESKQRILERYNLFVTHDKFHNTDMPGAISRLNEIIKYDVKVVDWLCDYLSQVNQGDRPVAEKEMVMMSHFFGRCRLEGIKVDKDYIKKLAATILTLWDGDFTPYGPFWSKVAYAYHMWHQSDPMNAMVNPKCGKEPLHGFPFLLAQLNKSMPGVALPRNTSNSNFWPFPEDLF